VNEFSPPNALNLVTYLELFRHLSRAKVVTSLRPLASKYFRRECSLVILLSPLLFLVQLLLLANQSPPLNLLNPITHRREFRHFCTSDNRFPNLVFGLQSFSKDRKSATSHLLLHYRRLSEPIPSSKIAQSYCACIEISILLAA
jgi:hypothetical protein